MLPGFVRPWTGCLFIILAKQQFLLGTNSLVLAFSRQFWMVRPRTWAFAVVCGYWSTTRLYQAFFIIFADVTLDVVFAGAWG